MKNVQSFARVGNEELAVDCNTELTCTVCPSDAVCRDNSLDAQVTALLRIRQPSIVNTTRVATLLEAHR